MQNELTWEEIANYRARVAMAESVTLTRESFIKILDFIETQDARMQIIAGHRDDYRKEAHALALRVAELEVPHD